MSADMFVTNILCIYVAVVRYKYPLNSQASNIAVAGLSVVTLAQVVVAFRYIHQEAPNAIYAQVVNLNILFIFSVIVVELSNTNALFSEIHLANHLIFIFLLLKKLQSIPVNKSSDNHQIAVDNVGAIILLSAINYYLM
jgi:hypothetical protein